MLSSEDLESLIASKKREIQKEKILLGLSPQHIETADVSFAIQTLLFSLPVQSVGNHLLLKLSSAVVLIFSSN